MCIRDRGAPYAACAKGTSPAIRIASNAHTNGVVGMLREDMDHLGIAARHREGSRAGAQALLPRVSTRQPTIPWHQHAVKQEWCSAGAKRRGLFAEPAVGTPQTRATIKREEDKKKRPPDSEGGLYRFAQLENVQAPACGLLRNFRGDIPQRSLNVREKCARLWKPHRLLIASTERSKRRSRLFAFSTRTWIR